MPIKPDGQAWTVQEQIIEDPASGLTIQFEVMPDGESRLRIYGECLPLGNREFLFDSNGHEAGGGSFTGVCKPAWLTKLD